MSRPFFIYLADLVLLHRFIHVECDKDEGIGPYDVKIITFVW